MTSEHPTLITYHSSLIKVISKRIQEEKRNVYAFDYLAGEAGLITLIGTCVMAAWLLWRLNRQADLEQGQTTAADEALSPV